MMKLNMGSQVKNSLVIAGLIIITLIISYYYIRNDKLHYLEEIIYFTQQTVKREESQTDLLVLSTGDLASDSINYYLQFINTKKPILLNIPVEDLKVKADNMFGIYDLMDSIYYTFYGNLFFRSDNSLGKHFLSKNEYSDSKILIDYSGVNSFISNNLNDLDNNSHLANFDIILVGYCGRSFYPFLDNDSSEVWNTPKGLMYNTILKATILTQLRNNNITRISENSEVLFYGFLNFFLLIGAFKFFVRNKYKYIKFKSIQLIHLLLLLVLSINTKGILLPLGLGLMVIVIVGELIYWLDKNFVVNQAKQGGVL